MRRACADVCPVHFIVIYHRQRAARRSARNIRPSTFEYTQSAKDGHDDGRERYERRVDVDYFIIERQRDVRCSFS